MPVSIVPKDCLLEQLKDECHWAVG